MEDRYTHGQHDHLLAAYETRTADEAAAFLRPHLEPGMAVIDIGCGPGSITAGLAPWVAPGRVLGVDAASESIARARVRYGLAWVDEAGFADATVTTVSWTYADPATRTAWAEMWANRLAEGTFREQTLEIGLATEQDLRQLASGWRRWSADPSAFFAFLNVQVTAIRPA